MFHAWTVLEQFDGETNKLNEISESILLYEMQQGVLMLGYAHAHMLLNTHTKAETSKKKLCRLCVNTKYAKTMCGCGHYLQ